MTAAHTEGKVKSPRKSGGCECPYCGQGRPFCWRCPCGFRMCKLCMEENLWGMSCNQVHWTCPDCGRERPFGNQ